MDNERILTMDPFMLLSIVNMKLRDFYSSIGNLCEDLDVEEALIQNKLRAIGYTYSKTINQFIAD